MSAPPNECRGIMPAEYCGVRQAKSCGSRKTCEADSNVLKCGTPTRSGVPAALTFTS